MVVEQGVFLRLSQSTRLQAAVALFGLGMIAAAAAVVASRDPLSTNSLGSVPMNLSATTTKPAPVTAQTCAANPWPVKRGSTFYIYDPLSDEEAKQLASRIDFFVLGGEDRTEGYTAMAKIRAYNPNAVFVRYNSLSDNFVPVASSWKDEDGWIQNNAARFGANPEDAYLHYSDNTTISDKDASGNNIVIPGCTAAAAKDCPANTRVVAYGFSTNRKMTNFSTAAARNLHIQYEISELDGFRAQGINIDGVMYDNAQYGRYNGPSIISGGHIYEDAQHSQYNSDAFIRWYYYGSQNDAGIKQFGIEFKAAMAARASAGQPAYITVPNPANLPDYRQSFGGGDAYYPNKNEWISSYISNNPFDVILEEFNYSPNRIAGNDGPLAIFNNHKVGSDLGVSYDFEGAVNDDRLYASTSQEEQVMRTLGLYWVIRSDVPGTTGQWYMGGMAATPFTPYFPLNYASALDWDLGAPVDADPAPKVLQTGSFAPGTNGPNADGSWDYKVYGRKLACGLAIARTGPDGWTSPSVGWTWAPRGPVTSVNVQLGGSYYPVDIDGKLLSTNPVTVWPLKSGDAAIFVTANTPPTVPTVSISPGPIRASGSATVTFTANVERATAPLTYTWSFERGDGTYTTYIGQNPPPQTFTQFWRPYLVSVNVVDANNNTLTASRSVFVSPNLSANVAAAPTNATVNQLITFTGSGSGGSGTYTDYQWNFGDGTASTVQNPTHAYTTAGTYTATLTVTDSDAATASNTVTVVVTSSVTDITAPTIPTNLQVTGVTTTSVSLNWTASTDTGSGMGGYHVFRCATASCTPTTLAGTVTSGTTFTDTLLTPGTAYRYAVSAYDVALNESAKTSSVNATTTALPVSAPVISSATPTPASGTAPLPVSFSALVSGGNGTLSYTWTVLLDGSTVNTANTGTPTSNYTFQKIGTYTVRLDVTDQTPTTVSRTMSITVSDPPPTPCTPDWQPNSWTICSSSGRQSSTGWTDANSCPSPGDPPATPVTRSCVAPPCVPQWSCTDWSQCTDGDQSRVCTDANTCPVASIPSPATIQTCDSEGPASPPGTGGAAPAKTPNHIIAGSGPGDKATVRVYDSNGTLEKQFAPFPSTMKKGIHVATGDVYGTGKDSIVVSQIKGGAPTIRIFDTVGKLKKEFLAYPKTFKGGISLAVGDTNGDGKAEIITAPESTGASPVLRVFSSAGKMLKQFYGFENSFRGGISVTAGDVNAFGSTQIIIAPSTVSKTRVRVIDASGTQPVLRKEFTAYPSAVRAGLSLASADVDANGMADIITAPAAGRQSAEIRAFSSTGKRLTAFQAASKTFKGGVTLAAGDLLGADQKAEILTTTYSGGFPRLFLFQKQSSGKYSRLKDFTAFPGLKIRSATVTVGSW